MLKWILKLIGRIICLIFHFVMFLLKYIFGSLFGWIPDFDERMSGEDFEEYVKEILLRNGYKKVQLTKRTGDYGIDILGTYQNETYAFQCKKYARPVGVGAIQQAYAGCEYYGYDKAVVVTNNTFTSQAIHLADSNGVLLWDREVLNHLKRKANSRSIFHRKYREEDYQIYPYESIIDLLLDERYASIDLLMSRMSYTKEKSFYILEDLEFYDLVSKEDHLGIRDLYFSSKCEAKELLKKK